MRSRSTLRERKGFTRAREQGSVTRVGRSGFTLLEMIIALAMVSVLALYVTDMLVRQNRAYTVVDEVTETQQSLRAIADLMEREARVTGFMVPEGGAFCGVDNLGAADIVFFSDSDAINPNGQTQLDIVADVTGGLGAVLNLSVPGPGNNTILDGVPFYDNDSNGVADADFLANGPRGDRGGVIVFDRTNPSAGTSCGIVTNVAANSISVDWNVTVAGQVLQPAPNMIPAGPNVVAIPAHWYAIVPAGIRGAAPQLWRNNMLIADDVEDLQFAAAYDLDGNGTVILGGPEFIGSGPAGAYVSNGLPGGTAFVGGDNSMLQEIRLNFVVRSRNQAVEAVQNPDGAQGAFQITENRIAPAQPPDGFRRRVHTLSVRPRNIGHRP